MGLCGRSVSMVLIKIAWSTRNETKSNKNDKSEKRSPYYPTTSLLCFQNILLYCNILSTLYCFVQLSIVLVIKYIFRIVLRILCYMLLYCSVLSSTLVILFELISIVLVKFIHIVFYCPSYIHLYCSVILCWYSLY